MYPTSSGSNPAPFLHLGPAGVLRKCTVRSYCTPCKQRWGRFKKKVSIEAIPMLYYLGKVLIKRLSRFKSQKFWMMKRYKYFNAKTLNRQSDCIVSNPRIFKDERYKYFYSKKFESTKRLYRFKTQNLLAMKRLLLLLLLGGWVDSQI